MREITEKEARDWVEGKKTGFLESVETRIQLETLLDLGNADQVIQQDYDGRYVFELLQNGADAHDLGVNKQPAKFNRDSGKVAFVHTQSALLVANTGSPFSQISENGKPSSLESISRVGESTKSEADFRGNKGLGFRSIYDVCSSFWLVSGPYRIYYSSARIKEELIAYGRLNNESLKILSELPPHKRVPMTRVGFWFEESELPLGVSEELNKLREDGYDTVLILDRKGIKDDPWGRIESLGENEMLFLGGLSDIQAENTIHREKSFHLHLERHLNEEHAKVSSVKITRKSGDNVKISDYRVYHLPIEGLSSQGSAVAFPVVDGKVVPNKEEDRCFYTFYPAAREKHGFPFFIHSYFKLSPNREYFLGEKVDENRLLLETLAKQISGEILPDLRSNYPDSFLPELLLSCLDKSAARKVAVTRLEPDNKSLRNEGHLTRYFTRLLLHYFKDCELIRDLNGNHQKLNCMKWSPDLPEANDILMGTLKKDDEDLPAGLFGDAAKLKMIIGGWGTELDLTPATVDSGDISLALAKGVINSVNGVNADFSAALIALLDKAGYSDSNDSSQDILGQLRDSGTKLLYCETGPQPLPIQLFKGKKTKADEKHPLMFYRPDSKKASDEADDESSAITPPEWCHVHVLSSLVRTKLNSWDIDSVSACKKISLREFSPESVLVSMAESMTLDENSPPDHHEKYLTTVLGLLQRRLRGKSPDTTYWFERGFDSSDFDLWYWLGQSWLPIIVEGKECWYKGNETILSGLLGAGDDLRPIYSSDQMFLAESNESEWFREKLDILAGENNKEDFRAGFYVWLGAWKSLRFDPKFFKRDERKTCGDFFKDDTEVLSSPHTYQSIPLDGCHLRFSASLPKSDVASIAEALLVEDKKKCLLDGLNVSRSILQRLRKADYFTPNGSTGSFESPLVKQLLSLPWVVKQENDDRNVWYTSAKSDRSNPSHEAHYLNAVTSREAISEDLARTLGFTLLEENVENLSDTVKMKYLGTLVTAWGVLCQKAQDGIQHGSGLKTAFQTIANQVQRLILGKGRSDQTKIKEAQKYYKAYLDGLKKHGVLVFKDSHQISHSEIKNIFYDDRGEANPLLRNRRPLVAFAADSMGLCRLLGLPLLSDASITYSDKGDTDFGGNVDIEEKIKEQLCSIRPLLFTFLCYSETIPAIHRLTPGSDPFLKRWEAFGGLKVECFERLQITLENDTFEAHEQVVLEHAPQDNCLYQRLFVDLRLANQETLVSGIFRSPALAAALATLLNADRVIMKMLLQEFSNGLESGLEAYLRDECGISQGSIVAMKGYDENEKARQERELKEYLTTLESRLESVGHHADDLLMRQLENLLNYEYDPFGASIRKCLQGHGLKADELKKLGFKPLQDNYLRFRVLRNEKARLSLIAIARLLRLNDRCQAWDDLLKSWNSLSLSDELAFMADVSEIDIADDLKRCLAKISKGALTEFPVTTNNQEDEVLWQRLAGNGDVPEHTRELWNLFRPWLVALVCLHGNSSGMGPVEINKSLRDRIDMEGSSFTPDDLRIKFFDWLHKEWDVQENNINVLLERWPDIPISDKSLNAKAYEVKKRLEANDGIERRHINKRVEKYVEYLKKQGQLPTHISMVLKTSDASIPTSSGTKTTAPETQSIKKISRNQDEVVSDTVANRELGQCGEEIALLIQLQRWLRLAETKLEEARRIIKEIEDQFFDLKDSDHDYQEAFDWLKTNDDWASEKGTDSLRMCLHMAGWRKTAPFDLVGLDGDNDIQWQLCRIEVKATSSSNRSQPFPISVGEMNEARKKKYPYIIWRIFNIGAGKKPQWYRLPDPVNLLEEGKLIKEDFSFQLKPCL